MSMLVMKRRPRSTYQRSAYGNPYVPAILALVIAASCAVGIWAAFSRQWAWQPWLLAWLGGVNITALGFFGHDKSRARRSRERVPEVVLYGLALAGGSIGGYAGMQLFRHKTVKGRFLVVYWAIVLLQMGLLATIIRHYFF